MCIRDRNRYPITQIRFNTSLSCWPAFEQVRNLRWQDIDFERNPAHIKQTKGEKEREVFLRENLKEF